MNLHQLRFVREAVRQNFNLTEAAKALYTLNRPRSGKATAAPSTRNRLPSASSRTSWARTRAGASIALVPSRSAETFGMAAAEAMAAGLPVVASRVGALPELVEPDALVPPGDAGALARAIGRLAGDRAAGERGLQRIRAVCAPEVVAGALAGVYDGRAGGWEPHLPST